MEPNFAEVKEMIAVCLFLIHAYLYFWINNILFTRANMGLSARDKHGLSLHSSLLKFDIFLFSRVI